MDPWFQVTDISGIPTPALLFYEEKIKANTLRVLSLAGDPSWIRPHVKTHKTKEICALQMALGISKFKAATIAEAEMAAQAGAPDVLLAYPLVGPNQARFLALQEAYPDTRFSAVFDDLDQLTILSARAQANGTSVRLLLDLDPGLHRTGVPVAEGFGIYEKAAWMPGVHLIGLHGYDGQNHQTDLLERTVAARHFHREVLELRDRLTLHGFKATTVVLGGTPTFAIYLNLGDVEVSPGTCFLHDWGYTGQFPDQSFEPAALLLTRVVSRHPAQGTFTLDLGHKALAADPPGPRGRLVSREPGFAESLFQNEEHWVFRVREGSPPRVGEEFYVQPTHICPTSALYSQAHVINGDGQWTKDWEIAGRNRVLTL